MQFFLDQTRLACKYVIARRRSPCEIELSVDRTYNTDSTFYYDDVKNLILLQRTQIFSHDVHTSGSRLSPSSWQMCSTRVIIISSESGLNLNFAHLEASGSMILQKTATLITKGASTYL